MDAATYRCTFGRVGRNHAVDPLEVPDVKNAGDLSEAVYRHVRPYLASRDIEVHVDLDERRGRIYAGFHVAGEFAIEEVA